MHELLLFGQVPEARHDQVLRILAGLSAMQPQPILEKHMLFCPISKPTQTATARGGTQDVTVSKQHPQGGRQSNANQDVYYVELVGDLKEDADKSLQSAGNWRMVLNETPVPGQRPTILRYANETSITSGDPQAYVQALGYKPQQSTIVQGHRFILSNTILTLNRTLIAPTGATNDAVNMDNPSNSLSDHKPLDFTGSYVLEAKVRIAETNPTLITRAEKELLGFKERMKGVLEMEMPERLSLDTRFLELRPKIGVKTQAASAERPPARVA